MVCDSKSCPDTNFHDSEALQDAGDSVSRDAAKQLKEMKAGKVPGFKMIQRINSLREILGLVD